MLEAADIIVAPITGAQRAPVAVLRASGAGAWGLASAVFEPVPAQARLAQFGKLLGGEDEGILTLFEEGHSYTGEESFEVSCHGSPHMVRRLLDALIAAGARMARAGEFTERAFLNGRMDLTQAEAIRETIDASTSAQHKRATELRHGRLTQAVHLIQESVGRQLAAVEAVVDFSEEIGDLDRGEAIANLQAITARIEALLSGAQTSRLLRQGLRVALVGRPNVGKSSLLNALLGADRAIVTAVPGTTRDTIEEAVDIGGYPVVFTDTAGIRETDDPVESIGVARSRAAIDSADQIWLILESHLGWTDEDEALATSLPREADLVVANKSDLGKPKTENRKPIPVSALTGDGLESLRERLIAAFDCGPELPLVNDRTAADLEDTNHLLAHAIETLSAEDRPVDLACVDLYAALSALGSITGETAPDEILERVFREFCIGK